MNFITCYLLHGIVNTNIIMKLEAKVALVFKNKEGKKLELQTTVKDMLERTLEDFYEDLEPECTSASCNNESQNFCDCGDVYEDYEVDEVVL